MKVIIVGKSYFGKATLDAFYNRGDQVVLCLTTTTDQEVSARAKELDIPLELYNSLKSDTIYNLVKNVGADIMIFAHVREYIPGTLAILPKHGSLCVHPSLLPKYRGPDAIQWAIINGEITTGISLFKINDHIDQGPLVYQTEIPIDCTDTAYSFFVNKLLPIGIPAILKGTDLVVSGQSIDIIQDEDLAHYERSVGVNESHVNWSAHGVSIYNLIRGCDPMPGAWTTYQGKPVVLSNPKFQSIKTFRDIQGEPGQVLESTDTETKIAVHGGIVTVNKIEVPIGTILI
jgi:methionyl-tRNA formyltransferase